MKFDNDILEYDDVMSWRPSKQLDFLEDHDYWIRPMHEVCIESFIVWILLKETFSP